MERSGGVRQFGVRMTTQKKITPGLSGVTRIGSRLLLNSPSTHNTSSKSVSASWPLCSTPYEVRLREAVSGMVARGFLQRELG